VETYASVPPAMSENVKIKAGWVIHGQAAIVPGLAFGPTWLKGGGGKTGPLVTGMHNLLYKDVVFIGKGKYALGGVVKYMQGLQFVKIQCGIREGMMVESFEKSEYGGGDDQVMVKVTRQNLTRVPYYLYVLEYKESDRTLSKLLVEYVVPIVSFAGGITHAAVSPEVVPTEGMDLGLKLMFGSVEAGFDAYDATKGLFKHDIRGLLNIAYKCEKVKVVLTSRSNAYPGETVIATHRHTHPMPYFAQDIVNAIGRSRSVTQARGA
jgi:hypothetical protein